MLPVELDGRRVFLAGVRDTPAESFRHLRVPADKPEMAQQLTATATRALGLFAGAEAPHRDNANDAMRGGLPALGQFLESSVPEAERQRISEALLRIVNGSIYELANVAREKAGLAPLPGDDATQSFMTQEHRKQALLTP
jgi:cytochrome c biogenesis protein